MPRKYVRNRGARRYIDYTTEALCAAVNDVKNKKMSLRKAGKHYNIPIMTIVRKVSNYMYMIFIYCTCLLIIAYHLIL